MSALDETTLAHPLGTPLDQPLDQPLHHPREEAPRFDAAAAPAVRARAIPDRVGPDRVEPTRLRERTTLRAWLATAAIGLTIFIVVTAEMLPVGVLPGIATELGVSTGVAGTSITVPGVVAAVAALLLPAYAARVDRRTLFCVLITVLAVASVLTALAPTFPILLAARVLLGICVGGVWAMMVGLAGRLVAARHVGIAAGVMFSGVAAASVLGIPAGTLLGDLLGWRAAFGALGVLGAVVLGAVAWLLPALPARDAFRLSGLPALLRRPRLRSGVLVMFFLVTGQFAAYTYVAPILVEVSGVPVAAVSAMLLAYGVAGLVGNFVAGVASVRRARGTIGVITLGLTTAVVVLPLAGSVRPLALAVMVLWGLSYGGVSVALQSWLAQAADDTPESAGPLLSGVFSFAIAFGALIGGRVVDAFSPGSVLGLAAVSLLVALLITVRTPPFATCASS